MPEWTFDNIVEALADGPICITKDGEKVAVVVNAEDWYRLNAAVVSQTPERIVAAVIEITGVTWAEITSRAKTKRVVVARHVAMFLVRELTDWSYTAIARFFNRKDHTTVMHAWREVNRGRGRNLVERARRELMLLT